jgi:hypothetical protein
MNEKMLEEMKLLWKLEDAVRGQRINMPAVERLLQLLEELRK